MAVLLVGICGAQATTVPHPATPRPAGPPAAAAPSPVARLYRQILQSQIAPQRVYRVDGLRIDEEDVQINLEHGTLGLFAPLDGRTTGAVFVGQGEIFVLPPDRADRLSMANFTGAPFLNEAFNSAYFRYSDGALDLSTADLAQPLPADPTGQAFSARWRPTVSALNHGQVLRLLAEFLNHNRTPYFYARIGGEHLGAFEVLVDRSRPEQIEIANSGFAAGPPRPGRRTYNNVWASFPMRSARLSARQPGATPFPGPDLRVLGYRVRTRIAPDLGVHGRATVRFRALLSGDRVITFALAPRLALRKVQTASGRDLLFVQNGQLRGPGAPSPGGAAHVVPDGAVAVILPRPLRAGTTYALRFRYAGHIIRLAAGGLLGLVNRMDWYPNRTLQPAPHDLTFLYPKGLTLVATGRPMATADAAPPGEQISRWVSTRPADMAGFNLGRFEVASARASTPRGAPVPIQVFATPGAASPAHLAAIARASAWTVEFYEQRFGPFPFSHLALTELPFPMGQGWPGLIYLAQDSFLTPAQMEDRHLPPQAQALYPLMRPHEIAHQWWGNEVAWKSYHDQWLYEALASYSALLDVNAQFQSGALSRVLAYDRGQLLRRNATGQVKDSAGPLSLGVRLDSARFPHAYDVLVYDKGAWVIHMLRELMRDGPPRPVRGPSPAVGAAPQRAAAGPPLPPPPADARFFAFLRAFCRAYQGRAATTADFERVADRFVPPRLAGIGSNHGWGWFFREWVDGTGVPSYAVAQLHAYRLPGARRSRARYGLEGLLLQSHVPLTFTMPVPIYLAAACPGEGACPPRYLGTVVSEGASTEFQLPLPPGLQPPVAPRVRIDPNDSILRR